MKKKLKNIKKIWKHEIYIYIYLFEKKWLITKNRKHWNKLNNKLKTNLKHFNNLNKIKKNWKIHHFFFYKTDPPNQFPWVWIISEKNLQKGPTTVIRSQN